MLEIFESAGFGGVRERDLTSAFARATRAYHETAEQYRDELRDAWGKKEFAESQRHRRATLALIEEGVVRRGLFIGRRARKR